MKHPVFRILSTATGRPTQGFVGGGRDVYEATAWFTKDGPDGEVMYEWIMDPPGAVEWVDTTFDWKRKFRLVKNGTLKVRAWDDNGFSLDTPVTFIRVTVPPVAAALRASDETPRITEAVANG